MKRRVTINFSGDEVCYHMAITLIAAQLKRGQTRGDGVIGLSAWSYEVQTDHSEQERRRTMSDLQTDQAERIMAILHELDLRLWPDVLAQVMASVMSGGNFSTAVWRDIREQAESIMKDEEENQVD